MRPASNSPRSFWLLILSLTLIVNGGAAWLSYLRWTELGVDLLRSVWGLLLLVYLGTIGVSFWLLVRAVRPSRGPSAPGAVSPIPVESPALRSLGWVFFLAILVLIPYIKFAFRIDRSDGDLFTDPVLLSILYYWTCWYALLVAMTAWKLALNTTWQAAFACALVVLGVVYEILLRFNAVTTYPLSMGWSEGSRYYYASLYFSRQLYGESVPLSPLHPSRYLLQSFPFLIPGLSITVHRFWQFLLWIGLTAAAALTISNRAFEPRDRAAKWLFAGWCFLFLLTVGVYYHLEVMVILPLLFVTPRRPWRSLLAVIAASLWAGISRVNWFPVPALIAVTIYLLETPFETQNVGSKPTENKRLVAYLTWPAVWGTAGLLAAFGAQVAYISLSGNAGNARAFASSFTSDLLWYRLWPNPNHFLGILPAILFVSSPLIMTLFLAARRRPALHPIRWIGLGLILGVIFAGSLVVSVKIGGGGDLHNMDAYAILLGVTAAYFIGGRAQSEPGETAPEVRSWPVIALAVLIPVLFLIPLLSAYPSYDRDRNEAAYRQLVQLAHEAAKQGPVLFINERQLVTFHDVHVPLVSDYEAVTLMEMAMSNNRAYLNRFYGDLRDHRFAAIVAVKQNLLIKQTGPLVEENNVWNSRVSPYILCYYHAIATIEPQGNRIEVYVPTADPVSCP